MANCLELIHEQQTSKGVLLHPNSYHSQSNIVLSSSSASGEIVQQHLVIMDGKHLISIGNTQLVHNLLENA